MLARYNAGICLLCGRALHTGDEVRELESTAKTLWKSLSRVVQSLYKFSHIRCAKNSNLLAGAYERAQREIAADLWV
jgi:hypothetical protein